MKNIIKYIKFRNNIKIGNTYNMLYKYYVEYKGINYLNDATIAKKLNMSFNMYVDLCLDYDIKIIKQCIYFKNKKECKKFILNLWNYNKQRSFFNV